MPFHVFFSSEDLNSIPTSAFPLPIFTVSIPKILSSITKVTLTLLLMPRGVTPPTVYPVIASTSVGVANLKIFCPEKLAPVLD